MTTLLVFYILSMLICIYGLIKDNNLLSVQLIIPFIPILNSIVAWLYFVEPYWRKK